jgi:hypothetical protein
LAEVPVFKAKVVTLLIAGMAAGMLGTAAAQAVGRMLLDTPAVAVLEATLETVAVGLMMGLHNVLVKLGRAVPAPGVGMAAIPMLVVGVEV